jgi:hypothetical protein
MKQIIDWLMQDEQKELYEILFALSLNILFMVLCALLLWPLGRTTMAFRFAKGYGLLWLVLAATAVALAQFRRIFRVDMYHRFNAYVLSALAVSGFLQVSWSAFAALDVRSFGAGVPAWLAVLLYLVGVLSCYVAFVVISSLYQGHIYKFVNLPLGVVSFLVFSVWPASGRALYGWFFDLFA